MKYRCIHCNHVFELNESEFKRCPNCFWTTSLVSNESGEAVVADGSAAVVADGGKSNPLSPAEPVSPQKPAPFFPIHVPWKRLFLGAIILAAVSGLIYLAPVLKRMFLSGRNHKNQLISVQKLKDVKPGKEALPPKSILTAEEEAELVKPFQITIPRKLTPDEEEILKKEVPFPEQASKAPVFPMWTKKQFTESIEAEEKRRKIPLGHFYVNKLEDVFEKHYVPAEQALQAGNYSAARDELIHSFAFPVYQNNVTRFRAVVLVMLRPFINETLGRIAVLNQYLASQNLVEEARALYASYQAVIPVLDLAEWEKAKPQIESLKQQLVVFETKSGQILPPPSPAMAFIDPELQAAIQREAIPPSGTGLSLKSVLVDLGIKEKVVQANLPAELNRVQKIYEEALGFLKVKDYEKAREQLRSIEFPPELMEDARKKVALIDKALAVPDAKI